MAKIKLNVDKIDKYITDDNLSLRAKILLSTIICIFDEHDDEEIDLIDVKKEILKQNDFIIKKLIDNKYLINIKNHRIG